MIFSSHFIDQKTEVQRLVQAQTIFSGKGKTRQETEVRRLVQGQTIIRGKGETRIPSLDCQQNSDHFALSQ